MRLVEDASDLAHAFEAAASEAKAASGDGSLYIEKYLDRPRHVEIQVLSDEHGNVVHLFERECSIQRRHQKVIEESPCAALDDGLRASMASAAVTAARAAGYVNAGTVVFLLDRDGRFYFLEVNARLQVEHPVTEMVTGFDLVRCQVEIASGAPLAFSQEDVVPRGHAIECRICAEDPERSFMLCPGRVVLAVAPQGPGVRYDSGIFPGAEVPVHYDPILSKLVVHAHDRPAAVARMARALEECVILGVRTLIDWLIDVVRSDAFAAGATHTRFIEEHFLDWRPDRRGARMAAVGHALASEYPAPQLTTGTSADRESGPASPWQRLGSWDILDRAATHHEAPGRMTTER